MNKIIDYQILSANSLDMLARLVRDEMKHNFQPLGGACKDGINYIQAMVEYAEK